MFKNRGSTGSEAGSDGERIEGIPIDRCEELGRSSSIAPHHSQLSDDPTAAEIDRQGVQSETLTLAQECETVDKAVAAHAAACSTRQLLEPDLKAAAREAVISDRNVRKFEAEIEKVAWRLPLLTEGSAIFMWLVLVVIAIGEFVLNRAAFQITGEDQLNVDVLAITVGVALVAAAHGGGIALRRVFDRLHGTKANAVSLAIASVVFALGLATLSIGGLRSAFFAEEAIKVPTGWLMVLQGFLLWVAVALSMAHANPLRAELTRRQEIASEVKETLAGLKQAWCTLRRAELDTEAAGRTVVARACWSFRVGYLHTDRQGLRFAAGVQETAAKPVSAATALGRGNDTSLEAVCRTDPIATTWLQWLAAHPASSEAPSVVQELDRLLASIAELPADEGVEPVVAVETDTTERFEPEDGDVVDLVVEPEHASRNGDGAKV